MHVLFLSDNFPPEVNAPASRTFEHAREWVCAGHRVTVVTCAPNFPKGRVFDGYRNRPFTRETVEGIEVIRVWSYIAANEGVLRRTLDYLSFMVAAVPASLRVERPDIVVATSPQIFSACAGWVVGALRRRPFVFELRDLWPESIRAVGAIRSPAMLSALERLELFLYRRATAVVSVTHAFRDDLIARGIDGAKIHVVTNGADIDRYSPQGKDRALLSALGLEGRFVAGYIGTHGLAHALETLLDTARLLQEQGRDDIRILLLGDGATKAELMARAQRSGLRNVIFLDTVPKQDVVRYWSILDAAIIHLRRSALFETVIPSKLFEAMAMGIPVLHGVGGESARIVEAARSGLTFEPESAIDLRDRIVELADDRRLAAELSGNGRRAAGAYDRRHLAARMLTVLEANCRRTASPARERGALP